MADKKVYNKPSEVRARDGDVDLDGPDHVDVSMTPEAAEETGDRLVNEAVRAMGQRRLRHLPRPSD